MKCLFQRHSLLHIKLRLLTYLAKRKKKYLLTNKKLHEFCLSQSTVHSEGGACTKGGPGHPGTGECANRWRGAENGRGRANGAGRQRGRGAEPPGVHANAVSARGLLCTSLPQCPRTPSHLLFRRDGVRAPFSSRSLPSPAPVGTPPRFSPPPKPSFTSLCASPLLP